MTTDADQLAFEAAMATADISVRELESCLAKLSNHLDRLYAAQSDAQRQTYYGFCRSGVQRLEGHLESAPVTRWRQKHLTRRNRQRAELVVARRLLAEHGIDLSEHLTARSA